MIVYAPQNIPQNRPLIISMHGSGQGADYQKSQAKWETIADTAKFIVVFPSGINKQWDLSGTSDINFILTIIDTMYSRYGIDRNRVYLSGFSMGGMMTYYAATKIADKIAAFAPISGYLMGGPNTNSSRPIPIIHTHGTADDVVSFNGVQTCMNAWITRNACPTTAQVTAPYPASNPNSIATKKYWGTGTNGVEIVLMSLTGKGHWISIDPTNGIHTSAEIWNFCKKFSLPGSTTTKTYDFSSDAATTAATTPPAANTTVGSGNGATAGVANYTDANGVTSNYIRAYSGGERNGTGVVDLGLFPSNATDYSVVWKQCLASGTKDYKVGVLLRANSTAGTSTTGYVSGIRQGYLFIVYTANGATTPHSEFRIYKSTSATSLTMLANSSINTLTPAAAVPMWYRASVSGTTSTTLTLEYSTNNSTWITAATYTDATTTFASGSTQLVWGLAANNWDFFLDNMTYTSGSTLKSGISEATSTTLESKAISAPSVVSTEYYSLTGQKTSSNQAPSRGFYIEKKLMSDGKVISTKKFTK
jgi:poly(hydroxyalkanoate) depolymerase family esterase